MTTALAKHGWKCTLGCLCDLPAGWVPPAPEPPIRPIQSTDRSEWNWRAMDDRCQYCSFQPTNLDDYCDTHRPIAEICRHCGTLIGYAPPLEQTGVCSAPACQEKAVRAGKRKARRYFTGRR